MLVVHLYFLDLVVLIHDGEFACFKFLVQLVDSFFHFCFLHEVCFQSLFELGDVDWLLRLVGGQDNAVVSVVAVGRVKWSFAFELLCLDRRVLTPVDG